MGYEYLLSGLPELVAGSPSPITMESLLTLFDEQLNKKDKQLLRELCMSVDDQRISELIARYDDEDILNNDKPEWWDELRQKLSEADIRATLLYEMGLKSKNSFIRDWYAFNQDMNNVLVASICRKHNFDIQKMIVGHNAIATTIRENYKKKDFGLSEVMDDYNVILSLAEISDLMVREKQMDALRFEWLEGRTEFDIFSVEQVFAYYLKVNMLNRWSLLTVEQGEQVFRSMVADMKKGVQL